MNYIAYKIKGISIIKILAVLAIIISAMLMSSQYYQHQGFSVFELMLILTSDKLVLSTIITLPIIVLASNILQYDYVEFQALIRLQNTGKWFKYNIYSIIINVSIFILFYYLIMFFVGILSNFDFSYNWILPKTFNMTISINGFDYTGNPFVLLINDNISPGIAIFVEYFMLILRCIFYILLARCVYNLVKNNFVSILVVICFNYFDIYFYDITNLSKLFIMPHEYSIITSIAGQSPSIISAILYWGILILTVFVLTKMNLQPTLEKFITNKSLY